MERGFRSWQCAICEAKGTGEFPENAHSDCGYLGQKLGEIQRAHERKIDRILQAFRKTKDSLKTEK